MRDWITVIVGIVGAILGAACTWTFGRVQMHDLLQRLQDALRDRWHVTLQEEFLMTRLLGQQITKAGHKFDIIFGVSPGGLMIAEWLSRRELGDFRDPIPVRSVCVKTVRSIGGVITERAVVISDLSALTAGLSKQAMVLLVNDVSRGGKTLQAAFDVLKTFFNEDNIFTATLFCHRDADTRPVFSVVETDKSVRLDWKEARSESAFQTSSQQVIKATAKPTGGLP